MKKATYLDKDEMELARSLENEEWVSDLTKKEKKQYEEYARVMYTIYPMPGARKVLEPISFAPAQLCVKPRHDIDKRHTLS